MGFFRQGYRSGLPCPPPGDLPDPGIEPWSLTSPALAGRFFTTSTAWEAPNYTCDSTDEETEAGSEMPRNMLPRAQQMGGGRVTWAPLCHFEFPPGSVALVTTSRAHLASSRKDWRWGEGTSQCSKRQGLYQTLKAAAASFMENFTQNSPRRMPGFMIKVLSFETRSRKKIFFLSNDFKISHWSCT